MKEIRIHPKALKEFQNLPKGYKKKVKAALVIIAGGSKERLNIVKIKGKKKREDLMRVRVGDYRVICKVDKRTLWVIRIAHRSQIYRDL
jgi:mRNA interferase RelE/StbE